MKQPLQIFSYTIIQKTVVMVFFFVGFHFSANCQTQILRVCPPRSKACKCRVQHLQTRG